MKHVVNEEMVKKVELYLRERTVKNPVRSRVIQNDFGIAGSTVRAIAGTLRERGLPVCSGSFGYCWAGTPEELDTTIRHFESRIRKMAARVKMLKKFKKRQEQLRFAI